MPLTRCAALATALFTERRNPRVTAASGVVISACQEHERMERDRVMHQRARERDPNRLASVITKNRPLVNADYDPATSSKGFLGKGS